MWTAAALFVTGLTLAQPQVPPQTLTLLTGSPAGSYREIVTDKPVRLYFGGICSLSFS